MPVRELSRVAGERSRRLLSPWRRRSTSNETWYVLAAPCRGLPLRDDVARPGVLGGFGRERGSPMR
jgi:hypothetical protein